jgi:hypothetical protein
MPSDIVCVRWQGSQWNRSCNLLRASGKEVQPCWNTVQVHTQVIGLFKYGCLFLFTISLFCVFLKQLKVKFRVIGYFITFPNTLNLLLSSNCHFSANGAALNTGEIFIELGFLYHILKLYKMKVRVKKVASYLVTHLVAQGLNVVTLFWKV